MISDLRTPADQKLLHGQVASTATAWRVLNGVDEQALAELWRHVPRRGSGRGPPRKAYWCLPGSRVTDRTIDHTVIDLDATLVEAHSITATHTSAA